MFAGDAALDEQADDEAERPDAQHDVRPPTQTRDTVVEDLHLHVPEDEQVLKIVYILLDG